MVYKTIYHSMNTTENNKRSMFFRSTFEKIESLCSIKKEIKKTDNEIDIIERINNIKRLDLPSNIKSELLAKFYDELEEKNHKFLKN